MGQTFPVWTLRGGAHAPDIDAEAVERDACEYKESHKPGGDPFQCMLTALRVSVCHEDSPVSRDASFALLHLASMRIITETVPSALAGTAQAVYGLVGVGGAMAILTILSGWLYARFGPTGF